ncbi:flagellar hook-length control protein FliK [Brevibacillus ruminantium]|uniref:Flagellar hook-length control protein FliK n=1 Tax=Brevibacillus ruminantium TaxID=2950604 RepID=A0ABY4WM36_9BACL|nr:flagellar hook-length control protein FliK [Brevibacillus ruminantium]USG67929.1 flagellar hook-length control protein FliK [Brevibacillus ruminantium]
MNVANLMAPTVPVASVPGTGVQTGATGQQAFGSLGNLFAMQMTSALESMQATEENELFGDAGEMDSKDMAELTELLALLQQFVTLPLDQNQEEAAAITEKASQLPDFTGKLAQLPELGQKQMESMHAAFTQRGLPQATAEKLAAFLTALSQTDQTIPQKGQVKLDEQSNELLKRLGLTGVQSEQGKTEEKKPSAGMVNAAQVKQGSAEQTATAHHLTQRASQMPAMQNLRVSHALASYQTEAGLQAKSGVLADALNGTDKKATEAEFPSLNLNAQVSPGPQPASSQKANAANNAHPVQANQFSQQVSQLFVKQMKLTQVNGVHEARLILYPQSLGQVDVKITSQNGIVTAHFSAETAAGKELLDNQLSQLRAALTQQGLQVERLEVSQQGQSSNLAFQQQQQRERQPQPENENQKQTAQDDAEFSLEALLDNSEEVISRIGNSR